MGRRATQGKEDAARLGERLGRASVVRPPGPLAWIHAASVGESLSVLPLIAEIRRRWPALGVLVTSGTPTSAAALAVRLPSGVAHQYAPIDTPAAVRAFLAHWRPGVALWVESELWPNALGALRRAGVPVILVNARLSDRSFRRWQRIPAVARTVLDAFVAVLAQSSTDATRFQTLGAPNVQAIGNLKLTGDELPADAAHLRAAHTLLGERPRWLAASTHPGEEEIVAAAHAGLAQRQPGLLTVLVPRHPARGAEIAAMLAARGLGVALRSRQELPEPPTAVYVADTLGELGLWYRLCPISLVGGSLVPHGGHNPIEPARLGCAVLTGRHVHNFQSMTEDLIDAGGATLVDNPGQLADAVGTLLAHPEQRARMGAAGRHFAAGHADVLPRVVAALEHWLTAAATGSGADPRSSR